MSMDPVVQAVKIFKSGTVELVTTTEGKQTAINCSLDDYVKYMSTLSAGMTTPVLPRDCRYFSKNKDKVFVVLEKPAFVLEEAHVIYGKVKNMHIPRTVWFLDMIERSDGTYALAQIKCYTLGPLDGFAMNTQLRKFIFPHYRECYSARAVCWGDNEGIMNNMLKTLEGVERLPNLFFTSRSTDHLLPDNDVVERAVNAIRKNNVARIKDSDNYGTFTYIYDVLVNAPQFAHELLVPAGTTIGQQIAKINGTQQ